MPGRERRAEPDPDPRRAGQPRLRVGREPRTRTRSRAFVRQQLEHAGRRDRRARAAGRREPRAGPVRRARGRCGGSVAQRCAPRVARALARGRDPSPRRRGRRRAHAQRREHGRVQRAGAGGDLGGGCRGAAAPRGARTQPSDLRGLVTGAAARRHRREEAAGHRRAKFQARSRRFVADRMGFARIDLVGSDGDARLVASLFALRDAWVPGLDDATLVARWSVDLSGEVRNELAEAEAPG